MTNDTNTSSAREGGAVEPVAYPMGSDREVLLYLMQQFDAESWECPRCGHSETTADMDSADYLRRYLAEHPTDTLRAQLEAAEALAERWKSASLAQSGYAYAAEARAEAAEAEVASLREALGWYAQSDNYYAPPGAGNPVRDDIGNRARGALTARTKEAAP